MIDTRKAIKLADLRPEELEPRLELQVVSFGGTDNGGTGTGVSFGTDNGGTGTGVSFGGTDNGGTGTGVV